MTEHPQIQNLLVCLAAIAAALVSFGQSAPRPAFYVSTKGNDAWSGRLPDPNAAGTDGPFATLERARDEMRRMKQAGKLPRRGVTVEIRGGVYERSRPFELTAADSGTAESRVVYRARPGEVVRLIGGKVIGGFRPVADPSALAQFDAAARGKVMQADLRAQGVTSFGSPSGGGLELFFQAKPMTLARWPNEGFVKIVDVLGKATPISRGRKTHKVGKFTYAGDRPKRWAKEKDLWVHGYWYHDWSDQRHKVKRLDAERRLIEVCPPYHGYGYRKGKYFYAFNLLSEIDSPGEWYLDREAGVLYFWPPSAISDGDVIVSVLPTLVTLKDASHVSLRGVTMEATRSTAAVMRGGTRNLIVGCTLRNLGSWAASISGGTANGVVGCDIHDTGSGGVVLSGGNRATLTPAGHFAENNHIHHYARIRRVYQPGIRLSGVGNRASHNLIHNAPHMGMGFGGNDHVIEFNEIHSVCYESNDAGAIYTGRDWAQRGTIIRHNYLHHICGFRARGCVGVYLDDAFSGTTIYGNLFYKVTRAAMIGGGRDNTIENNTFVDCRPAVHVDARGLGWAKGYISPGGGWHMRDKLKKIGYDRPPHSTKYPHLANILEDDPHAPKYSLVARNVSVGGKWDGIHGKARPYVTDQDNLVDKDPLFVDRAQENFQLRGDSPAYRLGFKRIPIEKIGLYQDARRASWPVKHTVRPMPPPPPPPRRKGPRPVFKVLKAKSPVAVDGAISPAEWAGADPKKAMIVQEGIRADKVKPRSLAWLSHDSENLYVAILNEVDASQPLKMGPTWGQDDAVEVALRNPAAGKNAPIFVLRGFPNGHFESSTEAGAPADAAKKAGLGVQFAAKVLDKARWTAEYQISFAALGIDPAKQTKFPFNLSVRKTADSLWLMWCGTYGYTWAVDKAGTIVLER